VSGRGKKISADRGIAEKEEQVIAPDDPVRTPRERYKKKKKGREKKRLQARKDAGRQHFEKENIRHEPIREKSYSLARCGKGRVRQGCA